MAEQEFVRAYQRTLASGKTIQVSAHNRTNADIGTAARKVPGRPPLGASGGNFPLGRSLPGIWVMPDPKGAADAVSAQAKITQAQQQANQPQPQEEPPKDLADLGKHPGIPAEVADFAKKLGGFERTTLPAKAPSGTATKLLGSNPPPEVADFAKKLGLSANTAKVVGRLKNLKWHDPNLVSLSTGVVQVEGYTRRTKTGGKERVRKYVRHQDLSPNLGAKKGTFSGIGTQTETPETFPEIDRSQFSNPDTPRTRGVSAKEFQAISLRGKQRMDQLRQNGSRPSAMSGDSWDKIKADGWVSVQSEWGGITVDSHTGKLVTDDGTDQYAMTVKPPGLDSESVPVGASQAEFDAAMERARIKFADELRMEGAHLGVFRDDAIDRIDIDPVLVVRNHDDVETIGAYTRNVGGAYNFRDGNGYWPPYVMRGADNGGHREEGLPQGSGSVASAGGGSTGEGPPRAVGGATPKAVGKASPVKLTYDWGDLSGKESNYSSDIGDIDKLANGTWEATYYSPLLPSGGFVDLGLFKTPRAAAQALENYHNLPDDVPAKRIPEALQGANPNYSLAAERGAVQAASQGTRKLLRITDLPPEYGYNFNCANAVTAYELRMRGYNVSAKPVSNLSVENETDHILARWRKVSDHELLKWEDLIHTGGVKKTKKLVESWGDGARGFAVVEWKRDGGHTFVLQNDRGRVRYLDAQTGREMSEQLFKRVSNGMVFAYRMDDLELAGDMKEYVQ